jgi:hypothetical protein
MDLRVGTRWACAACSAELVVVRAPGGADSLDLHCGDSEVAPYNGGSHGAGTALAGQEVCVQLGKRYTDAAGEIEFLCTKAGTGPLTWKSEELGIKSTRPLPSSD